MLTVLFLSFHGRMPCSHVINNEVMKRAIHPNEKMPIYWPRTATSKISKTVNGRTNRRNEEEGKFDDILDQRSARIDKDAPGGLRQSGRKTDYE